MCVHMCTPHVCVVYMYAGVVYMSACILIYQYASNGLLIIISLNSAMVTVRLIG